MINFNFHGKKRGAASFAAAALLLTAALVFIGCKQSVGSGGSGGGSDTPNSGMVRIKYDNSKIMVLAKNSANKWQPLPSGSKVAAGEMLLFEAVGLPLGQQVDKWKVNAKELKGNAYTVDAADALSEGSNKVITVTYTLKTAEAVTVRFDESGIRVIKLGSGPIHNGDTVYEGDRLGFNALSIPLGQQLDKWKINTKEFKGDTYRVEAADALSEGSNKVITVTYTLKTAEAVTVRFDESGIGVIKLGSSSIHNGDTVYEGDMLGFNALSIPSGQQVDKWKINTKEFKGNVYRVDAADALSEGSNKVITITYTLKTIESVTVRFDESTIRVSKGGSDIHDGDTVYEGYKLHFAALNIPHGRQLDKWKVNTKELPWSIYELDVGDAVLEGSNKVIRVTYTTKPAVNPVIVKFDPTFVSVYDQMSGMNLQFGQTVYEDTKLNFYIKSYVHGTIDKWFVNAKEFVSSHGASYIVDPTDAVDENGVKVLRIRFTVKDAPMLTVQFNSAEVECNVLNGTTMTPVSSGYQASAYTYVILNAKIPAGKRVKHREVNGNMIPNSAGALWLEGQANPDIAASDGRINISVIFE